MTKEAHSKEAVEPARSQSDLRASLQNKSKEEIIALLLEHLKDSHNIADEKISAMLAKETLLPGSIFSNDKLSALETIVKFLKEDKDKTLHEIAELLNRDDRSIWTTYHNAQKKMKEPLAPGASDFFVPADIFAERKLSVLETLASYLKKQGMSNHDIATALHRDDRTIWTVVKRAQAKRGGAA